MTSAKESVMSGVVTSLKHEWHALEVSQMLQLLGIVPESGLSTDEAARRREIYGPNIIEKERRISPFKIFARQFMNLMIIILLVATLISAFLGEVIDAIVIFVIVLVATTLGFTQEFRSEKIVAALKKLMTPSCNVLRDGVMLKISSEDVVPGDILLLDAGDRVVADARVIESFGLQAYEAALTGESIPIPKITSKLPVETPLADRVNMVYAGTTITSGKGKAVVVSTGMNTEFGKIAKEIMEIKEERPPLERRMNEVAKTLGKIILVIIAIIAIVDILGITFFGEEITEKTLIKIFMFSVSLAVAAVPEALPAIVTSTLAVGMWMLAKRNSVVRNMAAVETLGSTEVICSDKTGTITRGEMVPRQIFVDGAIYEVSDQGVLRTIETMVPRSGGEPASRRSMIKLAETAVLASDATVKKDDKGYTVYGDPTEGALVLLAEMIGLDHEEIRKSNKRIGEIPFSSERKRMTTITASSNEIVAHMKGAPEVVLSFSKKLLLNGEEIDLTEEWREKILQINEEMASNGLRVLGISYRNLDNNISDYSEENVERDFTFIGLVGILDPPRPEAPEAVQKCIMAGCKPIMITGDHLSTAVAVAREVGIYREGDLIVSGAELDKMSDEELEKNVDKITVYARVTPSHKLRIVQAWKKRGKTVAMTGDGVNDAPALKSSDIGVAMGIKGTEVTKEASDMILLDDNFATIVKAVELGRWIYDNIKKYLAYLLQANFVEIAVIGISALLILPLLGFYGGEELLPLLPVQILYINLATDGLPAIALGFSPADPDIMKRRPRPRNESVFTTEVKEFLVRALVVEAPILLIGFINALPLGIEAARSRLFLMFIAVELAVAINCRSLIYSVFKARPHKLLILTIIWEIFLISLLVSIPAAREALYVIPPTVTDLYWIISAGFITFLSIELLKRIHITKMFAVK